VSGSSLRFTTHRFRFAVHSRLHAPNTEDTFRRFQAILAKFLGKTLPGKSFTIRQLPNPRELFTVEVDGEVSLPTKELCDRLENDTIN
jgi:hypothetical protein